MLKVIDVDKLFDKYISGYVYKNVGKIKPEEIEDNIPVMYEKFGIEPLEELDGFTPQEYYKRATARELFDCLKKHAEDKVPVPDFLFEAIIADKNNYRETVKELTAATAGELCEEYAVYLMNAVIAFNEGVPAGTYTDFILSDYPETIKELATETLAENADAAAEELVSAAENATGDAKERIAEVLSHVSKKRNDKIFDILVNAFIECGDKVSQYAGYLARYGDERAIPFLTAAIENEKISYADFEELRFAIEALGGEYDKKRDFTADKTYKKIKSVNKSVKE